MNIVEINEKIERLNNKTKQKIYRKTSRNCRSENKKPSLDRFNNRMEMMEEINNNRNQPV